jgi:hypothetical protein
MGLLSGPGGGGILGLILNGVQNVQQGLPFLAGPEERKARQQTAMEMKKEEFKTKQDTQKAVVSAIADIFKNPDKQTTETIKWAKDMAPQVGMDVPEGTVAGMYGQAYDKLVNKKQFQSNFNAASSGTRKPAATPTTAASPSASNTPIKDPSDLTRFKSVEDVPYSQEFLQAASTEGIKDPAHYIAMNSVETRGQFNPQAVSPKGARGLGQIMPNTAIQYGANPKQLFDAPTNIKTSAKIYKDLENKFNGDKDLIAAAYNAGPGAVAQHKGIPPYQETQEYVGLVNQHYKHYAQLLGNNTATDATVASGSVNPEPVQEAPIPGEYDLATLMNLPIGTTATVNENGEVSSFKIEHPTLDQQTAAYIAQQPVGKQMEIYSNMIAQKQGRGSQFQQGITDKGIPYSTEFNPERGTTRTILGVTKVAPTKKEEQNIKAYGEGEAVKAKVLAGGALVPGTTQTYSEKAATTEANQRKQVLSAEREVPVLANAEQSKEQGAMIGSALDIGEGFDSAVSALTDLQGGKFDISDLPTGVLEPTKKAFANKFSTYTPEHMRYMNTVRNRLAGVATNTANLLFALGGKNLTETEKRLVEDLQAGVELDPDAFTDRLLNGITKIQYYAKGHIAANKANKIESGGLEELYKEVSKAKETILRSIPEHKSKLYKDKSAFEVGQIYIDPQTKVRKKFTGDPNNPWQTAQ